jgi:hypothetical protein
MVNQLSIEWTMEAYDLVKIIQRYQNPSNQINQMHELIDIMLRRAISRKDEAQLREMSKRISAYYLKEIFPEKIENFSL